MKLRFVIVYAFIKMLLGLFYAIKFTIKTHEFQSVHLKGPFSKSLNCDLKLNVFVFSGYLKKMK